MIYIEEGSCINQIEKNLYLGGLYTQDHAYFFQKLNTFDSIYNFSDHEYIPPIKKNYVRWYFQDTWEIPDVTKLHHIANMVAHDMKKGPTLVHCTQGWNRSGLVCGLALIKSGYLPIDAIKLMREKRTPEVLCNDTFYNYVMG